MRVSSFPAAGGASPPGASHSLATLELLELSDDLLKLRPVPERRQLRILTQVLQIEPPAGRDGLRQDLHRFVGKGLRRAPALL